MRIYYMITALFCLISANVTAQRVQNSGWLFLMNNNKISKKWGTHLDVQFRSADEWSSLRNFLFRPGVTYFIDNKNDVTLGYLLNQTYSSLEGSPDNTLTEHRIWQQYIHKHKISSINVSHRVRLEQRFIERNSKDDLFAQRFRYFVRFLLPLQKVEQDFEKGFFAALQNETFFNIQSKDELNGSLFDQNRAYVAGGYRFSKKFDAELGYMNQASKGVANNTSNNILQLALYTRF